MQLRKWNGNMVSINGGHCQTKWWSILNIWAKTLSTGIIGFDALTHNKASFLILKDKARLSFQGEDLLRCDSLKLFSQAFALAYFVDDKAGDRQASEEQKSKEMLELHKRMDYLKTENNQLKDLF